MSQGDPTHQFCVFWETLDRFLRYESELEFLSYVIALTCILNMQMTWKELTVATILGFLIPYTFCSLIPQYLNVQGDLTNQFEFIWDTEGWTRCKAKSVCFTRLAYLLWCLVLKSLQTPSLLLQVQTLIVNTICISLTTKTPQHLRHYSDPSHCFVGPTVFHGIFPTFNQNNIL